MVNSEPGRDSTEGDRESWKAGELILIHWPCRGNSAAVQLVKHTLTLHFADGTNAVDTLVDGLSVGAWVIDAPNPQQSVRYPSVGKSQGGAQGVLADSPGFLNPQSGMDMLSRKYGKTIVTATARYEFWTLLYCDDKLVLIVYWCSETTVHFSASGLYLRDKTTTLPCSESKQFTPDNFPADLGEALLEAAANSNATFDAATGK